MADATRTTWDHDEIRNWAEERGAVPACVRGTGGRRSQSDVGMIRLDFPGYGGETSLQEISWDAWFQAFDNNDLALIYRETTADGQESNFNKLVARESVGERGNGGAGGARTRSRDAASTTSTRSTRGRSTRGRSRRGTSSVQGNSTRATRGRSTRRRG